MADGLMIAFAALHLERDLFFAANMPDDVRHDRGIGDGRRTHRNLTIVIDQQHAIQRHGLADFRRKSFDLKLITSADAILLASGF